MILEYFNKFFLPILLEIIYSLFIVKLERFSYKKYTRIIIIALFLCFFFLLTSTSLVRCALTKCCSLRLNSTIILFPLPIYLPFLYNSAGWFHWLLLLGTLLVKTRLDLFSYLNETRICCTMDAVTLTIRLLMNRKVLF